MSVIDPRMAQRRHIVAEHGARRRLRNMIVGVIVAGLVGVGWWTTQSELLDIDVVAIGPTVNANVATALADAGLGEGSTLLAAILGANEVEAALEADPWVRAATVNVLFPSRIEIEVIERTAVAVVAAPDGTWMLTAADLTALEAVEEPPAELGAVAAADIAAPAMDFLAVMGDRGAGLMVLVRDGNVWVEGPAVVALLGRAIDMEAKAAALLALLDEDVPDGWAINLVAPSRPALFQIAQPST